MATLVPGSAKISEQDWFPSRLQEILKSLMGFTGAGAAWVGIIGHDGRLVFPSALGDFTSDWLTKQQGSQSIWGFTFRENSPTLLNDAPPIPGFGKPHIRNVLSSPVFLAGKPVGQIVLANKAAGFTSHDASVLQAMAHLVGEHVVTYRTEQNEAPNDRLAGIYRALEKLEDGIVAFVPGAEILFANSTFLNWSGFEKEDLLGRLPPYPFWISHRSLYALAREVSHPWAETSLGDNGPALLPFRKKDDSIFWRHIQSLTEETGDREISWVVLRKPETREPVSNQTVMPQPVTMPECREQESKNAQRSSASLVLRIEPGREIDLWDKRWENLTGLNKGDVAGMPSELVLDWIFPIEAQRSKVADLLHGTSLPGDDIVLDVLTPAGSSPFCSTWLPVEGKEGRHWIVLFDKVRRTVSDHPDSVPPGGASFLRGLNRLLNHYFLRLVSLAEGALEQSSLSSAVASSFEQILDLCQQSSRLLNNLQDLALVAPSECREMDWGELVQEFLHEQRHRPATLNYELVVDLPSENLPVRANPRMLKTALRHLFVNAEQAVAGSALRRISVSLKGRSGELICTIADTGEGIPLGDSSALLAPFISTKGPFGRDATHAAMEATGLGLTVTQHLLRMHAGRLELARDPKGGTIATIFLPRSDSSTPSKKQDKGTIRTDTQEPLAAPAAKRLHSKTI
ncbi:MAG: ATP-binding protein [Gemmataceae bacterium]